MLSNLFFKQHPAARVKPRQNFRPRVRRDVRQRHMHLQLERAGAGFAHAQGIVQRGRKFQTGLLAQLTPDDGGGGRGEIRSPVARPILRTRRAHFRAFGRQRRVNRLPAGSQPFQQDFCAVLDVNASTAHSLNNL